MGDDERRLTYLPWMDGLRAIAVVAVMVYHEMISQPSLGIQNTFNGGLLGVDVFFAISGFLITALLLQEAHARGGIRFGAFYLRRARRLLPALFALLIVIVVVALVGQHGHHRTRTLEHVGITVAYSSNWVQAFSKSGMAELGQTWSLAIEEQFYLLWPALLTVLLAFSAKRLRTVAGWVAAVTVVTVAWVEFAAYRHWSFIRVYYGLDTRAASLAFGALLGACFVAGLLPTGRGAAIVRRVLAIAGVLLIALLMHNTGWFLAYVLKHHMRHLAYVSADSIYLAAALGTALVIWELLDSKPNIVHRVLSTPPMVGIGRISYAVYLWDGTFTVWFTPSLLGFGGWKLVVFRVVATFAASIASWFLIERRFLARRSPQVPAAI